MSSKNISEDKSLYCFKKIPFNELRYGQLFVTRNGSLFMKIKYCSYSYYAVDMITGEVSAFDICEAIYPVDCDITYRKILQPTNKED